MTRAQGEVDPNDAPDLKNLHEKMQGQAEASAALNGPAGEAWNDVLKEMGFEELKSGAKRRKR